MSGAAEAFGQALVSVLRRQFSDLPPGLDSENFESAASQWSSSVRFFGPDQEQDLRREAKAIGLAPVFVDTILTGYDAATAKAMSLSPELPFGSDAPICPRLMDVCATVLLGGKPVLCPFTGERAIVRDSIDLHTFLHRAGEQVCVLLPDSRIDQAAGDRCWYFPEHRLVLSSTPGLDGLAALARMAQRVVRYAKPLQAYLADPARTVMVGEEANGHIGHYVWNVISGWTELFKAVPAERVGVLSSYPGWNLFGGVTELYPEQAARAGLVARPVSDLAQFELMLERRALSLTLLGQVVTEDLAARLSDWSRVHCQAGFLAEADALRQASDPLVMATIRTGNRAWVEQAAGYARLIQSLAAEFPHLGIVLDGMNSGMEQVGTHGEMSLDDELAVAAAIMAECPGVRIFNSLGCLLQESIVLATMIDGFVAPIGAGLAKTRWVANKPGVAFSNKTFMQPGNYDGRLYDRFRESAVPMRYVGPENVLDVEPELRRQPGRENFSMDWQAPLPALREILANSRGGISV